MGYANPEKARAYQKAYYKAKMNRIIRPYGKYKHGNLVPLVTKNSILFLFGEGHEGLGIKERKCLIG
jgi:hypothetical protein